MITPFLPFDGRIENFGLLFILVLIGGECKPFSEFVEFHRKRKPLCYILVKLIESSFAALQEKILYLLDC